MEDNNASSYQVNQDNKEYLITTQLLNELLRVECQDSNIPENPTYAMTFSLNNFKEMDYYFRSFNTIQQIQDELNAAIENQSAAIFNNGDNTLNISFYLKNNIAAANINLKLFKEETQQPKLKEEPNNYEFQGRCSCPLDNERIDKLEEDSNKLLNDHQFLRNEINQLIEKINGLNMRIGKLKDDNAKLNQKTMELREENNSRRIEASKLRENNEAMKRQNQQLREKKNRLEFLLKEHHDTEENQYISKTSKSPFGPNPEANQINQRTGGATMMTGITPVMGNQSNKNSRVNSSRPIIVTNTFEDNPTNTDIAYSKGTIIRNNAELELIVNKINRNNSKLKLDLIYKATTDSDRAEAFHYHCNGARNSIVLIETINGKRFGGYTSQSWEGDGVEKQDPNAFIFSLDKLETYDVLPNKQAIGCYPDYGAVFLGCQIRIYDNAFKRGGTTFAKGVTYLTNEDYELTGGEKEFGIKEIEAYNVTIE
jgi:FtsZ-binding cell division protein ZapB